MSDIKVGRFRSIGYVLNYPMNNGMVKRYEWSGMKGEKVDIKPLPEEVIQYLAMNSACFRTGDLKIIEDTDEAKDVIDNLGEDKEDYKNNTLSKEELIKLLNGNYKKLESEVKKMNREQLNFMIDIAKEINLDSTSKQKILAEATGVPFDILFEE